MDFNNLTDAQKMILFGQVSVLLGSVLISLGNLLAMSEPPSQPMYGSVVGVTVLSTPNWGQAALRRLWMPVSR